jgi:hypothetical protein
MLSAIRPLELSQGTAENWRIAETTPISKRADHAPEYREHEDPAALRLNRLLEAPRINAGQRACSVRENYDHLGLPRTAKMRNRQLVVRTCGRGVADPPS